MNTGTALVTCLTGVVALGVVCDTAIASTLYGNPTLPVTAPALLQPDVVDARAHLTGLLLVPCEGMTWSHVDISIDLSLLETSDFTSLDGTWCDALVQVEELCVTDAHTGESCEQDLGWKPVMMEGVVEVVPGPGTATMVFQLGS